MFSFIRKISSVAALLNLPRARREIVIYSEGRNYWVHLEGLLKAFLDQYDTPVCYISSGENDPGLELQHPNLTSFLIDEGAIRDWVFKNIDCDILLMTMPDLDQFQVKRSRHPVHYVYVQHSLVSKHMVYRPGAFDAFDTIFCGGPHHPAEIRALETAAGLPEKNLVNHGYSRLDSIIRNAAIPVTSDNHDGGKRVVLIAPSWGPHSISDTVAENIIQTLLTDGFEVIFRPHPQTQKFSSNQLKSLKMQFGDQPGFELDLDIAGEASLHRAHVMISDWSGAALDFALGLSKPVLFVDTPRKVNNPGYEEIDLIPIEVTIREKLGSILSLDCIAEVSAKIREALNITPEQIATLRDDIVFNAATCDEVGADALAELHQQLKDQQGLSPPVNSS